MLAHNVAQAFSLCIHSQIKISLLSTTNTGSIACATAASELRQPGIGISEVVQFHAHSVHQ
jgi:hypothetical protein